MKGIGEMDEEPTMGDVLDVCVDYNLIIGLKFH